MSCRLPSAAAMGSEAPESDRSMARKRSVAYNKFGNNSHTVDGITFQSSREARRYIELKVLLRAGEISDLELQKKYELIPAQYEYISTGEVYVRGPNKGKPKLKKKCVEEAVNYYADFVYKDNKTGKVIVNDAKGYRTEKYIIKRKLMLYIYNIKILET